MRALLLTLCLMLVECRGAVYYVSTTGNDVTGNGTKTNAYLTIGKASSKTVADDIVRVQPGLYDSVTTISRSGTLGHPIIYLADGSNVVTRQFVIAGCSNIVVCGFEITQVTPPISNHKHGIYLAYGVDHITLLDNYIHDVAESGIGSDSSTHFSYFTARGNRIVYPGHYPAGGPPNMAGNIVGLGMAFAAGPPDHTLIEYNTLKTNLDFVYMFGTNAIGRNNYMRYMSDSYWTNTAEKFHSDMFQDGSDGVQSGMRFHLLEANFMGDNQQENAHLFLYQDQNSSPNPAVHGDTNAMFRGNVAFHNGDGAMGVLVIPAIRLINNTLFRNCEWLTNQQISVSQIYHHSWQTNSYDQPTNAIVANNIIYAPGSNNTVTAQSQVIGFTVDPPYDSTISVGGNLGYAAGVSNLFINNIAKPAWVSTNDPLFADTNSLDFRLQSTSPAIGLATNILWITSLDGSGTQFTVNDNTLLNDGWGMTIGDTITVGNTNATVLSCSNDYVTVTVSTPLTWTNLQPVYWNGFTHGEIGAYPSNAVFLSAAGMWRTGNVYTVVPVGDMRQVQFYSNGVPVLPPVGPPFSYTNTANAVVTAKAMALYAQPDPVIQAPSSNFWQITIASSGAVGVIVTNTADINGVTNGITPYVVTYPDLQSYTISAPSTEGSYNFLNWQTNGVVAGSGELVTLTASASAAQTNLVTYTINQMVLSGQGTLTGQGTIQ